MTHFGNEMKKQMGRYGFDKRKVTTGALYLGIRLKKAEAAGSSSKIQPLMAFKKA